MLESYFIQTCGVQLLGVTASTEMRIPITLLFANFNIIVLGLMSTYSFQYKIWLVGKKITSVLHDDQISCSTLECLRYDQTRHCLSSPSSDRVVGETTLVLRLRTSLVRVSRKHLADKIHL